MNYNEQINKLLEEWQAESSEPITKDGLMNKPGEIDVNKLWETSTKRVMFLLKDQPNSQGDDIRNWLIGDHQQIKNNRELRSKFLRRLAWILYAITYNQPEYWNISFEQAKECFLEVPFAFIETKKTSGNSSIKAKDLSNYIKEYERFLTKEIELLDPNIIVCCGGPQYHFVLNVLYSKDKLVRFDKNVYFVPAEKKVILYTPHPSARVSDENYYSGALWYWGELLRKHPDIENYFCPIVTNNE